MKLSDILTALGGGFEDGDGYIAICPAHEDTKPSLRVAYSGAGKVLLACRAGCTFNEVVMAAQGFNASDLFDVEDDMEGVTIATEEAEIEPDLYTELDNYVHEASNYPSLRPAYDYALKRFGVSSETFNLWQLGHDNGTISSTYDNLFGTVYSRSERLVVPFRSPSGEIRGLQSRAINADDKTRAKWSGPSNPKSGGTWAKLAYFDAGTGMDWIVITEGPGDAMTAAAAGGVDAIGIRGASMATAVAEELAGWLQDRTVFLAGDGDAAGKKFNETLSRALALRNVPSSIMEFPKHVVKALPAKERDLTSWFDLDRDAFTDEFQEALSAAEGATSETKAEAKTKPVSDYIPTTDVGLARYILNSADGTLAHSPGLGWLIYEDGSWIRDDMSKTRKIVYAAADEMHKLADAALDVDTQSLIRTSANRLLSTREIDKFMIEMEAIAAVDIEQFNKQDDVLVAANGNVNLRTSELTDHDPELYATQRVAFDYDPDAECPRWERFLAEVFPDDPQAMSDYMQRLVGYGITGETKEQCFAILWGLGANGKSVFTNTLSYVFDELTKVTPFSTFEAKAGGIPNDLAALHGARIVLASEGERGKPMAEAVIKRATGMDKIPARFLRQEFFEFTPKFLLWLATNHKPNFKSADAGLWRRVKMIPWTRYFAPEERDHYLESDLQAEAEGILAWAVEGARLWYADGLNDPDTVIEATAAYKSNADALTEFIGSAVHKESGEHSLASDVYKAYKQWAFNNDLGPKDTWGRNTFYQSMDERGYRRVKKNALIVFENLSIDAAIKKEIL